MINSNHNSNARRAFRAWLASAFCLLLTGLPASAGDNWSFDITPYVWVAGVKTETSLSDAPPLTPPVAARFDAHAAGDEDPPELPAEVARFDTRITGGALLAAQARYRSVGLFVDFTWLRLDTEASQPGPAFSSGNLESDFIHTTLALTYRLPLEGSFHAELLAGARLWYVNEEISYQSGTLPGFNLSGDKTWVDPVFGAALSYDLSEHWSLVTRGTAGGASSGLGWEVLGAIRYEFSDWCSATFGYRYLHEDFGQDQFSFNTDIQGFILGVGFHF